MESNSVIVAEGADHPALLADSLYASDVHWISDTPRQLQVSSTSSCLLPFKRLHPLTQRCGDYQTGQSLECEYQVGHLRAPARCQVELAGASSVGEAANEGTTSAQLYHVRFIDRPHWYAGAHTSPSRTWTRRPLTSRVGVVCPSHRGIAPHQVIAFYAGQLCLGGGLIHRAGPSYWQQRKPTPTWWTV
jgi:hypothetical protein